MFRRATVQLHRLCQNKNPGSRQPFLAVATEQQYLRQCIHHRLPSQARAFSTPVNAQSTNAPANLGALADDDDDDDFDGDETITPFCDYRRELKTKRENVRCPPTKLRLLTKQISGLSVTEAMVQMQFSHKLHAHVVKKVINNACNLADIRFNIKPENLRISEVSATKGLTTKRVKFLSKGRSTVIRGKHSHLTVVVKEIFSEKQLADWQAESGNPEF